MRREILFALTVLAIGLLAPAAHASVAPRLLLEEPQLQVHRDAPSLGAPSLKMEMPLEVPLDDGGGDRGVRSTDPGTRQVLCFILGFFPGFGIGHLLAGSRDGFILFLIVDVAVLTAAILLSSLAPSPFYALAWLAWILEHVFQGYDAYEAAGGEKLVERSVRSLMYASDDARGTTLPVPRLMPAVRALSFDF